MAGSIHEFIAVRAAGSTLLRSAMAGDAAVLAHPEVAGNAVRLLIDNAKFRPSLLTDMKNATKVINVQEFIWTKDGLGREVLDMLKQKVIDGVEVNVQIDGTGSGGFPFSLHKVLARPSYRHLVSDMRESGINVAENWRFGGAPLKNGALRSWDHRKVFTIDGSIAYLGGINLSKDYEHWHDVMVRVEGPAAAQAGAEFLGRWVDHGGSVSARNAAALADAQLAPKLLGNAAARVITNSPGAERQLTASILDDIRRSTKRLWITTPSIGSPEAVNALIVAKKRGVDVRVVVPTFAARDGDPFTRSITMTNIDELVAGGVKVYEHPRTVHAKVMLSDDVATISSFNLNMRSHTKDMEAGLRVRDAKFASDVERTLRIDFDEAHRVTPADGKHGYRQALRGVRELFGLKF
ncbi:MAG: phosphatidylserine/phosphatidylglycerophosphate/cardiolipin synthase family protein [Thermoleophilia bacterium]|nr:phosphatidylserine/phosphatidylglycerophosphate/cardiolipin synthase family protein [Thermoleophilia bacterium]